MILLSPKVKQLIAPSVRQGVGDESRKLLIYLRILAPDRRQPSDTINRGNKGRYVQPLLDKLRIVGEVRQPAVFIPGKSSNLLIPEDYS